MKKPPVKAAGVAQRDCRVRGVQEKTPTLAGAVQQDLPAGLKSIRGLGRHPKLVLTGAAAILLCVHAYERTATGPRMHHLTRLRPVRHTGVRESKEAQVARN